MSDFQRAGWECRVAEFLLYIENGHMLMRTIGMLSRCLQRDRQTVREKAALHVFNREGHKENTRWLMCIISP